VAIKRSFWVELFWRWHPRIYRASSGRVLGKLAGLPVLLLETKGRRSGEPRETALTYMPYPGQEGKSFVVIASVLGEPLHPAWYLNLSDDSKVAVTVGPDRIAAEAREAEGDEREAIWDEIIRWSPDYAQYRDRTERRIPVIVLDRRGP